MPRLCSSLLLSLLIALVPLAARSGSIVETATFGPLENPYQGGYVVGEQFLGVRFHVDSTVTTGIVGGHFRYAYDGGSVFAAIVSLTGPVDLPNSLDLSTPDVVGSVLIPLPWTLANSRDYQAELEVTLTPGWYGLLFGAGGVLGANTTDGQMPGTNHQMGDPAYFWRAAIPQDYSCYSDDGPPCTYNYSWQEGGFSRVRMFVYPIPEPGTGLLVSVGLVGLAGRRRVRA